METTTFKTGNIYPFRVVKVVIFSEHERFAVLEGPLHTRHLLDKSLFPNQVFRRNTIIQCRIDKINCSGKIFLEPQNPGYSEGNTYKFTFLHNEIIVNSLGEAQMVAVMQGRNTEKAILALSADDETSFNEVFVTAVLARIKKGILILHKDRKILDKYQFYKTYPFQVVREGINHKRNPVFILSDDYGNEFSIQKDNYTAYDIVPGKTIHCKITGCGIDWRFTLEPVHPYLEEGKIYPFTWLRKEFIHKHSGETHETHIVSDYQGNEQVAAPVVESLLAALKNPGGQYKIERIHKGKLLLIPV